MLITFYMCAPATRKLALWVAIYENTDLKLAAALAGRSAKRSGLTCEVGFHRCLAGVVLQGTVNRTSHERSSDFVDRCPLGGPNSSLD